MISSVAYIEEDAFQDFLSCYSSSQHEHIDHLAHYLRDWCEEGDGTEDCGYDFGIYMVVFALIAQSWATEGKTILTTRPGTFAREDSHTNALERRVVPDLLVKDCWDCNEAVSPQSFTLRSARHQRTNR
ncbi:hypothetical protein [Umezawaea tangerina]|uniref:Uncharacterized protein n=1 Tax=Umezawaea tangerina TaxID=84725 RepID=A0A2T0T4D0_9PSEU|nr:hypothetical protein [Umezawaea tangerina]PRY40517.1 hypothetical protein CLV43_106254 [Umezawaea tangerina]